MMTILRRSEKAMMRAMCGVKLIQKIRSQELEFAGFKGYFRGTSQGEWRTMTWACFEKGPRNNGDVLRGALDFEVAEKSGRPRPNDMKKTSRKTYRSDWIEKGRRH